MAWNKFPYPEKAYAYPGAALQKSWERLHRGDCEPFPEDAKVQDAWRSYHAGDFGKAVESGLACGLAGYNAANKAAAIYANYLESDDEHKCRLLLEVARRCEEQQGKTPTDANAWYLHAYALGRYSQSISVVKALAQGLGGKIKHSLTQALELEPGTPTQVSLSAPITPRCSTRSGRWSAGSPTEPRRVPATNSSKRLSSSTPILRSPASSMRMLW
jgi:hypothetical protein